jgi:hypothetical protein
LAERTAAAGISIVDAAIIARIYYLFGIYPIYFVAGILQGRQQLIHGGQDEREMT